MSDSGQLFHSERGVGVLPFLPLLARLGVDQWIEAAGYPETSELSRVQNVLSFIALKLAGHNRYSQDDLWAMDRGFGLFSNLNVLPKDGTLSSYSYRTNRHMNRRFLTEMFRKLKKLKLLTGQINMDFTAIPHWGDSSVLENNWSGKYGRRLKSVLSLLCQDPDTGIFCYRVIRLTTTAPIFRIKGLSRGLLFYRLIQQAVNIDTVKTQDIRGGMG